MIRGSYALTWIIATLMSVAMVAKHEAAHVIAGRYVGVDAYCRLSHRLFFPVIEADLTDLWTVGRAERYLVCAAGMVSDLVVASGAVIGLWLRDRGALTFGADASAGLELLIAVAGASVLFQFNFFLRTDLYYIGATALGCRNLAADARAYALALVRRRPPEPKPPLVVRLYAAASVVGTSFVVALGAVYVVGVVTVVSSGRAAFGVPPNVVDAGLSGRIVSGAGLLGLIALVGWSMLNQRRTSRWEYRLRAPRDL